MININSVVSRFDGEIKHDKERFKAVREGEVNPEPEDEQDTTDAECDVHKCFTVYRRKLPAAFWNSVGVDPAVEGNPLADGKVINYLGIDPASPVKKTEEIKKLLDTGYAHLKQTLEREQKLFHEEWKQVTWAGLTSDAKKDER